jgi:uncharacterized membrane protein required for colicin V production
MSFIDGIPKEVKVLGGIVVGAFVAYGIYRLVAHKKSPKGGGGEV